MRVLLVDDHEARAALLKDSLLEAGHEVLGPVSTGADLNEEVRHWAPEVIVIDVEAPGRDTLEQMRTISREQPRPIVMFSGTAERSVIKAAISAGVSAYVVDGLSAERVQPIMEVAMARFQEFEALRQDAVRSKALLEERKLIERAKGLLMSTRHCGEAQAYQTLQKMAMDTNRRLVDVARDVVAINKYLK